MSTALDLLFPEQQRRSFDELRERIDLSTDPSHAKQSAYWITLFLSAIIAISGIIGDSAVTVVGAMIVAPLAIPILGVGLGIASGRRRVVVRSATLLIAGIVLVIALGYLFAQFLPNPTNVLTNSQVSGRTSPKLMDLTAALATGLVASVAMIRRDVSDVLPGVAVAISLVPPLGVVGVCLGSQAPGMAVGAFILFCSNVVALILTAMIVFTLAGYPAEARVTTRQKHWRTYSLLVAGLVAVAVPMSVNSLTTLWAHQISDLTRVWLADRAGAVVNDVTVQGGTATVTVLGPTDLPPLSELQASVDDALPWHPDVVLVHLVGGRTLGDS